MIGFVPVDSFEYIKKMQRGADMKNRLKVIIITFAVILLLIVLCFGIFLMWLTGDFGKSSLETIKEFESPDGSYTLAFCQIGDPAFPFGPTDVRLILKDRSGNELAAVDEEIMDDGANSGEGNVAGIEWGTDAVTVTLRGSEMEDKDVIIYYKQTD